MVKKRLAGFVALMAAALFAQAIAQDIEPPPGFVIISGDTGVTSEPAGNRCLSSNGIVYYTPQPCWKPPAKSAVAWQADQVQDMPGAVMVGPNTALNPYSGNEVNLDPPVVGMPAQPRMPSGGGSAAADLACAQARQTDWNATARERCAMGQSPDDIP